MAGTRSRSFAASAVGWLIVAIVAYLLFGYIVGVLRWILRIIVLLVVIGALMALYLKLRRAD